MGARHADVVATAGVVGLDEIGDPDGSAAPTGVDGRVVPGGFRGKVLRACPRFRWVSWPRTPTSPALSLKPSEDRG